MDTHNFVVKWKDLVNGLIPGLTVSVGMFLFIVCLVGKRGCKIMNYYSIQRYR